MKKFGGGKFHIADDIQVWSSKKESIELMIHRYIHVNCIYQFLEVYFSDLASCISRLPLPWCTLLAAPGLKFPPGRRGFLSNRASNRARLCLSGFARSPSFCQWRIILSRCPGVPLLNTATNLLNTMQYHPMQYHAIPCNAIPCNTSAQYQSPQNDTMELPYSPRVLIAGRG